MFTFKVYFNIYGLELACRPLIFVAYLFAMRLFLLVAFLFGGASCQNETSPEPNIDISKARIAEALAYCKKNGMNQTMAFFLDMQQHSGRNRFVVYSFKEGKVLHRFPVSHGCGGVFWNMTLSKNSATFSNVDGSHCSSLGKYKIGERAYSQWGVHTKYVLHGLEASNSNAFKRTIVLHSWERVPDEAIYPDGTPEGWGCPAISNNNFERIDPLLRGAGKPVLLWMY